MQADTWLHKKLCSPLLHLYWALVWIGSLQFPVQTSGRVGAKKSQRSQWFQLCTIHSHILVVLGIGLWLAKLIPFTMRSMSSFDLGKPKVIFLFETLFSNERRVFHRSKYAWAILFLNLFRDWARVSSYLYLHERELVDYSISVSINPLPNASFIFSIHEKSIFLPIVHSFFPPKSGFRRDHPNWLEL